MTQEEIMNIIDEEDVEFIRLQFTDISGNLKNVAVTPGQMEKVFANRYSFHGSTVMRDFEKIDSDRFEDRLYLHPDMDTFVILPWRPQQGKVAKIVCDVCHADGSPFMLSSRRILKNILKKYAQEGYSFMADPNCQFFLFHTDEYGLPTTVSHEKAGYMDVGPVDFGENARRDIVLMLEDMDFDVEASYHVEAPAQHEISFREDEALKMADDIQTFRFAVRSIAKRFGLYATFMPKPKSDCAGSGMHTNISVYRNGKNIFENSRGEISEEAYHFIGGILKHANALTAIGCPIVNSYKRLLSGFHAPSRINWSSKGEKSFVKLIDGTENIKVELRFPDGASNPYLILAATIAAGMDGIEKKLDPGKDISLVKEEKLQGDKLVGNLKDAVDALRADTVISGALGTEFTEIYSAIKYDEWDRFMKSVSEWEIDEYLTRI